MAAWRKQKHGQLMARYNTHHRARTHDHKVQSLALHPPALLHPLIFRHPINFAALIDLSDLHPLSASIAVKPCRYLQSLTLVSRPSSEFMTLPALSWPCKGIP